MPFYEMLPGGMPAGLQSDMDAVLNKKWGTSTTYPPEGWPGTVNLMGPLPEKTVSGSVVTFSDGADAVLLKSCAVTIAPNLDGVSSVDVVHMGKNLCNPSDVGNYAISGTDGSVATNANSLATYNKIPVGSNTEISVSCGDYCDVRGIYCYGANDSFLGRPGVLGETNQMTRTLATGTTHIRVTFRKHGGGAVSPSDLTSAQIEYGSSSTTYSPYVSTTHTANLGRTIYGGSVDVVNGTGTESAEKSVLDPTETWLYSSSWSKTDTNVFYTQSPHDEISFATWSDNSILLCDTFPVGTRNEINNADTNMIGVSGNVGHPCITVRIDKTTCPDLASFIQYITNNQISFVYKKATPESFTFTPVPILSRLGDNTMWGDGDLSVTYRRDIDLALAQ